MDIKTSNITSSNNSAWLRDDRHSHVVAGTLWILIVLMIVPDDFNYQILATTGAPTSGGEISRILWLWILVLGTLIISWRAGIVTVLSRNLNPFLLLFFALAAVSIGWSIDPSLSVRRVFRMMTIVLACVGFVSMGWHAHRFQNVVRPILTIMLIGSILFGLIFPTLAIQQQNSAELVGAWHGLANQKNSLGAIASIGLIFWFHAWLTREVKFLPALVGVATAGICLVLSRSSTALAATPVVMIFLLALLRSPQNLRPYMPYLISMLILVVIIYSLAILNLIPGTATLMTPITMLTGKNMTFTGRTEIWAIIADHIHYHPFLGTGYGAYWTPEPILGMDSYEFMWRMGSFYPGSAHNGYLDIVNDLGWTGLICFIGYVITYIRQSLQLLRVDPNQAALYLALFLQQAITNMSETHWFSVLSVDFVIMTLATTSLARGLLEHQLHLVFGTPHLPASLAVKNMPIATTQNSFARPSNSRA